jgi:hypothetical protein
MAKSPVMSDAEASATCRGVRTVMKLTVQIYNLRP